MKTNNWNSIKEIRLLKKKKKNPAAIQEFTKQKNEWKAV